MHLILHTGCLAVGWAGRDCCIVSTYLFSHLRQGYESLLRIVLKMGLRGALTDNSVPVPHHSIAHPPEAGESAWPLTALPQQIA